ncbi:hypothetical protein M3194_26165 [Paenibacillus glycanilyticus]|uniref:hypothetical protein n=1 Tax=Paenibacillus glycanilyticus TaxID=126569 RepID=UPI00203D1B0A|nr:hypothetical protein [Paenibacillus glycanilyticus]MCM3630825.1 hypothetical protein [Paenibacillus glycanilyticus]
MKIEIKTLQDFIDIKAKMEGVIVITDKPTSSNKTHRLSCPYLEERHFTQKVVQNKNLNGHYF